jgi:UDP-N-acetylmuramyl tripeptide synthase
VVEGAHQAGAVPWEVVLERTEAIERALASARRGDVVLIFGRSGGTGTAYDLADRLRPLDDRADALAALERLR